MEWKFLDYPLTQRYPATPIKPINLLEPGGGGRKRRNSSSKAAVGRVRGNRCFGVSRPISPKWNERGWAIVEADPRRVYIYISVYRATLLADAFLRPPPLFLPLAEIARDPNRPRARARARARATFDGRGSRWGQRGPRFLARPSSKHLCPVLDERALSS